MAYRDQVRDEAIAAAKAYSHPEVEPRHLLWGLLEVLDAAAPSTLSRPAVRALLTPRGTATASPTVPAPVEERLSGVTDKASALVLCGELASSLLGVGPPPDPAGSSSTAAATQSASDPAERAPDAEPAARADAVPALLAELDALVGLGEAKASVRRLIAVQRLNAERRARSLPEVSGSHHVVFTGPPGTGKTTVARLLGKLYGAIGVVSKGHLVEASRADLVAGYVGQTALKVQAIVEKALGGVLFIDEAYALARGDSQDFGEEAVATLVKMMEDHRDNLAVIVAGYPAEMRTFIDSNPGLRSRFTHYVDFPDYATGELVQIFGAIAVQAKVDLAPDVLAALPGLVARAQARENFGNARWVRSLFERSFANMAQRAVADERIEPAELGLMTASDLPAPDDDRWAARRPIGFRDPSAGHKP
ncbi:MAG TPA: AAA family ATPase [Candidatus Limnocylindrales bacterium]|nr:AAA family ATPase [Candidatus Limnocylindrales bacterium]